jgi:multicomponent Na+:H+ antiporter subunit F
MTMTPEYATALAEWAATIALGLCGLALVCTVVRLARGPSLPDRVVALDLIGMIAVGMIACYDIVTEQPVLLDAATVVALVAFLGTAAFARYVERRGRDDS